MRRLLALVLVSCGATDGVPADLYDLNESARTVLSACSWRGAPTGEYSPREPGSCYNVYTWQQTRITDHQLMDPCDAPDEPNPLLVRPDHPQLWGYYDRDKVESFRILRYEQLETCP